MRLLVKIFLNIFLNRKTYHPYKEPHPSWNAGWLSKISLKPFRLRNQLQVHLLNLCSNCSPWGDAPYWLWTGYSHAYHSYIQMCSFLRFAIGLFWLKNFYIECSICWNMSVLELFCCYNQRLVNSTTYL